MKLTNCQTVLMMLAFSVLGACSDNNLAPNINSDIEDVPSVTIPAGEDGSLGGTIIGSKFSVDYSNNNAQTTKTNTKANVFDRNFKTFFASYDRSNTWVGLDLGEKHIITKVGYSPRSGQAKRVELALIEGANNADFSDALPIYLIPEAGTPGEMTYANVECSRGFRYVRYVTPNDARCNLAELAFYGTKGEGDDSKLYQLTNLPTVVINTLNSADIVSKEDEISSTVYIISKDGTDLLTGLETGVRGRGNASWQFPKKPYRLKFDKKVQPLDAPAKEKKWTLINNYGDKTLMRNILAFELSRRVEAEYTPFCQPVDVILNGEYRGCYQFCDQMESGDGRIEITEMEPEDNSGEALTGGYLLEIDAHAREEKSYFISKHNIPVRIKSPDDDEITAEQKKYITDYFNMLESCVFSSNFDDNENGFRKYLEIESFIKHFIVGEVSGNTDTYWSMLLYKERGDEQFRTGPVWDFDIAFDNDNRTYPVNQIGDFIYSSSVSSVAGGDMREFIHRMIEEDSTTHAHLEQMWNALRQSGALSSETLLEYIDQTAKELEQSQRLNFKRWPILNSKVHQNPMARGTYQAEVEALKDYIKKRLPILDDWIN